MRKDSGFTVLPVMLAVVAISLLTTTIVYVNDPDNSFDLRNWARVTEFNMGGGGGSSLSGQKKTDSKIGKVVSPAKEENKQKSSLSNLGNSEAKPEKKENDSSCATNSECQSGNCVNGPGGDKWCQPKESSLVSPTPYCSENLNCKNGCTPNINGGKCNPVVVAKTNDSLEEVVEVITPTSSPLVEKKENDSSCATNSECQSGNCVNGPGGDKWCQPKKLTEIIRHEGDSCATSAYDRQCAEGLVCKGNKCVKKEKEVVLKKGGEKCLKNDECQSGNCMIAASGIKVCEMEKEEKLARTAEVLDTVTLGTFGDYVGTYAEINAENPNDTYLQRAFNLEGVEASAKLGSVLTAEAALAMTGANAVLGGGSAAFTATANMVNSGYSTYQVLEECDSIADVKERKECRNAVINAALAYVNLGTAQMSTMAQGAAETAKIVQTTSATNRALTASSAYRIANGAVSAVETGVNVAQTVDLCSEMFERDGEDWFSCVVSAGVTLVSGLGNVSDMFYAANTSRRALVDVLDNSGVDESVYFMRDTRYQYLPDFSGVEEFETGEDMARYFYDELFGGTYELKTGGAHSLPETIEISRARELYTREIPGYQPGSAMMMRPDGSFPLETYRTAVLNKGLTDPTTRLTVLEAINHPSYGRIIPDEAITATNLDDLKYILNQDGIPPVEFIDDRSVSWSGSVWPWRPNISVNMAQVRSETELISVVVHEYTHTAFHRMYNFDVPNWGGRVVSSEDIAFLNAIRNRVNLAMVTGVLDRNSQLSMVNDILSYNWVVFGNCVDDVILPLIH